MKTTTLKILPASVLAFVCFPVLSLQAEELSNQQSYTSETLLVTASRLEESTTDTLASVSVIDRTAIELSQAPDLLELLRLQTGIDIVRSGPAGTQTSLFMRGTNSNHTLVLIDGVRVNSTNTGSLAWENLPLAQIERIEIVRGPRASFYGADAIGGVIQIFTREANRVSSRLSYGSFGSKEVSASVGYHQDDSAFSMTADWRDSDGFSAQNQNGFAYDPDKDGFNTWNVSLRGRYNVTEGSSLRYSLLYTDNENEFDQGISDSQQRVLGLSWSFCNSCNLQQSLNLGYTKDNLNTQTAFGASALTSDHLSADWQGRLDLGQQQLTFGLDVDSESGRNRGNYNNSRNNIAAYTGLDIETNFGEGQFALRLDDSSDYGSNFSGSAAWGLALGENLKLIASYGTAYRAPTMNELYSPGFFGLFAGNPNLNAETSDSAELALRWNISSRQNLNVSLFSTRIDDLIAFAGVDFQAININQAEIEGLEAEYSVQTQNWQFTVNGTLQDTENKSTGAELLRRPQQKYSLVLDRHWDNGAWLGAEVFYSGKREDFGATLASYSLLNLRAGMPLGHSFRVEARVENVLDEFYQPAFGFNAADRAYFISINWQQ
ncbi:MAG: TonB-dependent receptor [Xanthomonadales bacterium]|nr:TonB-dependent receptor [Xanthomonadales bacterium]